MCDYLYEEHKCIFKGECDKKDTCPIEEEMEKQKQFLKQYFGMDKETKTL